MNESRSVIVVFVSRDFSGGLEFLLVFIGPINDCAGTRFILSDPRHDNCSAHMVSLRDMHLLWGIVARRMRENIAAERHIDGFSFFSNERACDSAIDECSKVQH